MKTHKNQLRKIIPLWQGKNMCWSTKGDLISAFRWIVFSAQNDCWYISILYFHNWHISLEILAKVKNILRLSHLSGQILWSCHDKKFWDQNLRWFTYLYADACLLFRIVRSVMAVVTNRVCTTVGCAQSCAHVRSLGIHSGQKGIENTRT